VDVHDDVLDTTVRAHRDLGVTLPDAWEAIDLVAREGVSAARHTLDGNRIVAKLRDETILFGGRGRAAGGERGKRQDESLHDWTFDISAAARKAEADEGPKRVDD
jgi:hypothetical protein